MSASFQKFYKTSKLKVMKIFSIFLAELSALIRLFPSAFLGFILALYLNFF